MPKHPAISRDPSRYTARQLDAMEQRAYDHIRDALELAEWDLDRTARTLQIPRADLIRYCTRHSDLRGRLQLEYPEE